MCSTFCTFFSVSPHSIPDPNSDSGDGMSQAEPLINSLPYFYGKISPVLFQEAALLTFEWMSFTSPAICEHTETF